MEAERLIPTKIIFYVIIILTGLLVFNLATSKLIIGSYKAESKNTVNVLPNINEDPDVAGAATEIAYQEIENDPLTSEYPTVILTPTPLQIPEDDINTGNSNVIKTSVLVLSPTPLPQTP